MVTQNIILEHPERFAKGGISKEKLDYAIKLATDRLRLQMQKFGDKLPAVHSVNNCYPAVDNDNWGSGMYIGEYWLAYELTGDEAFKDFGLKLLKTCRYRVDNKIGMDDHDVGFAFIPSCIMAYKLFGIKEARDIVLDAAEYYYNTSYSKKGGFILRAWGWNSPEGVRTMMDTLMNIPILFWAGKEAGKQEYIDAAISQYKITEKYLIRDDASSYHHYQFDFETHAPVRGLTWQGNRDESCWSRGHSWGVFGFPKAYAYTKDETLIKLHHDVTYFMLNHLPEDYIPYWDYDFVDGDEPRDSSAAAVAICGLDEMNRYLPDSNPDKQLFKNASDLMMNAIIDKCLTPPEGEADGILWHVTGAKPIDLTVDECAVYGDYFLLEALLRYTKPELDIYW